MMAEEAMGLPDIEETHIHIEAPSGWIGLNFGELWRYRELLFFFTWRDIKVRYKQTLLGAAWAVLQPFATMVIFSVFFGRLAGVPSDEFPYPIFAYSALLPWNYFAGSLERAANSLIETPDLIRKVYFPRLVAPLSAAISPLLDFGIAFLILLGMMVFYGVKPTWGILLLPLFLLLAMVAALGIGTWFSALNVQYRDVRYVIPFLIQAWLFATPVAYPSSLLADPWRTLYGLNPMVGVVEGFRWALLGADPPRAMIAVSALASIVLLLTGLHYFRRMENTFADVV